MNRKTGGVMDTTGNDHLQQSIQDILTTPIGSRVGRRTYGSLVTELIDQPLNDKTVLKIYAATVKAVVMWEKRLRITRMRFSVGDTAGSAILTIHGTRTDRPSSSGASILNIQLGHNK